jgi:tetratricopeptide (TPR) repeat protein
VPLTAPSDAVLLNYVKQAREVNTDRSRFVLVASEERMSDRRPERCVKYHTSVEDHAQAKNNGGPVYLLDVHGYSCVHPQDPYVGLDFSYAVRAPREAKAEESAENADDLLREINFEIFKPAELSAFLYNSGITLRHQGQFAEAETMLKRALAAQEKISGEDDELTGRRMAELAAAYIAQGKLSEGVPLVERLLPLANGYSEGERHFLGNLFAAYAEEMRKAGQNEGATRLEAKSKSLGSLERE